MAQITCQFQGQLVVPLFKTPFTITMPGYYTQGISGYAAFNGYGDTGIIGEIYNHQQQAEAFTPYSVTGGECVALRYIGTNKFSINGGWNPSGDVFISGITSYYAGKFNYGFNWSEQDKTTLKYTNYVAMSISPFFSDRNVGTIQPPMYEAGDTSNWQIANSVPNLAAYGGKFTNLPCVIGAYSAIGFAGGAFIMGNSTPYLVAVPPGFMWPQMLQPGKNYSTQLTGHSITNFEVAMNFPVRGTLTNYLFGFGNNAQITRIGWTIPTYVVNQLNVLSDDTIIFDNKSNLNAQLSKYAAYLICTAIGVRGFLATDIDGNKDYFVSVDGTKYWLLAYVPQGNAVAPHNPTATERAYKFIDSNGVFWYTGSTAWNGSTIQPLYSLGANIPYGVFSLNFPPFSLPCYEDGCGNSLGIDWPGTGIYSAIRR